MSDSNMGVDLITEVQIFCSNKLYQNFIIFVKKIAGERTHFWRHILTTLSTATIKSLNTSKNYLISIDIRDFS